MHTRINSFTILLIIFLLLPLYSQDKDTVKNKGKEKYNVFEDYKFYEGRPTIDLSYGISKPDLFNSGASFIRQGLLEMKLGYTYEKKYRYGNDITKYVNRFIYGGFFANINLQLFCIIQIHWHGQDMTTTYIRISLLVMSMFRNTTTRWNSTVQFVLEQECRQE
ncbi:MAG: hypothetical protein ABSF32_06360 [Ignavibacteria bacterium]